MPCSRTKTATVELAPSGVVVARIDADVTQSLDDARENLAAWVESGGGSRRPLLVDITRSRPLEPEVRHYYGGEILVDSFSALGLLIEASPVGRTMGNIYVRVARPGIPTRVFTEESDARQWLESFLQS